MTPFVSKAEEEYKDDSWREEEDQEKMAKAKRNKWLMRRDQALEEQSDDSIEVEDEAAANEIDRLEEGSETVDRWNGIGPLTGERYLQMWKGWHLENIGIENRVREGR
jgi:hypothetical protein